MYNFIADFKQHDDKKQPYSFYCEKNSHIKHGNGYVEDGTYFINCLGGRNMVLTPDLQSFKLESEMCVVPPVLFYLSWGFFIGYDVNTRAGKLVDIQYHDQARQLSIVLFDINVEERAEIARVDFTDVYLDENIYFPVALTVDKNSCKLNVKGYEASFEGDFPKGLVGVGKIEQGGAGFRMKSLSISSDDEIKSKSIY